jgi:hypothetical protein
VNLPFQVMDVAADLFELGVVVGGDCFVAPLLQLFDLGFDVCLVDAFDLVVLVHVYAERRADSGEQVLFV